MDLNELMTRDGMASFTGEQRDTFVTDATQIRQMSRILRARIAQTSSDGDKPWSAKRRATKVGGRLDRVAKLLEKAAAECEALDATYSREVLELPARRATALAKKEQRQQAKALTRAKAHAYTRQSLTESTQHFAGQAPPPPTVAPTPVYNHPHAYPAPHTADEPLPNLTDLFPEAL